MSGAALAFALASTAAPPSAADDLPVAGPAAVDADTLGTATLWIETRPESLEVYIDGTLVGRSPIGPLEHPAGPVRVRVLPPDPRRFGPGRDAMDLTLARGTTRSLYFDLRPSILIESEPAGAMVTVIDRAGADSLLGPTPLSVPPGIVEGGAAVRFTAAAHADTLIHGAALAEAGGVYHIELRRVVWSAPQAGPTPRTAFFKKKWFQWTLVGMGTALSVSAIGLHQEADDWYAKYLASSSSEEIPYLYDQTTKYDRLAGGALIVGQTALVTGIVMLLLGQKP